MQLPPRGSIQDHVLTEMVQRERFEEFTKVAHVGRVIAAGLHVRAEQVTYLEELLELAVFQTAYSPDEIRNQLQRARKIADAQREEREHDARLMRKVASYSEPDEDGAEFTLATIKRNKLTGVKNPWKT